MRPCAPRDSLGDTGSTKTEIAMANRMETTTIFRITKDLIRVETT